MRGFPDHGEAGPEGARQFGGPGPFGGLGPFGHHGHGPFGHHGRGRGRGENWRPWGGFGGRPGPAFDRGEVKFLILSALEEGPKHGYEIMRAIEAKTQGAYVPSAGTVYPTLQLLEDLGSIQGRESDGRKVFTLTDSGRAYLTEHAAEVKTAWGRFTESSERGGDERRKLREELAALARSMFAEGRIFRANDVTLSRIRAILVQTRQQIDNELAEKY